MERIRFSSADEAVRTARTILIEDTDGEADIIVNRFQAAEIRRAWRDAERCLEEFEILAESIEAIEGAAAAITLRDEIHHQQQIALAQMRLWRARLELDNAILASRIPHGA